MKYILGNQEQRKTKIDTERWKEHAKIYSKPATNPPMGIPDSLEKILRYVNGKPVLTLIEMEGKYIRTSTQEEYDTLMQVYESANWKGWPIREYPTYLPMPTTYDVYISASNDIHWSDESTGKEIITTSLFYLENNISTNIIKELNDWYDTNKPDRASKG